MRRTLFLFLLAQSLLFVLPACGTLPAEDDLAECHDTKPKPFGASRRPANRPPIAVEGLQQLVHKPLLVLWEFEHQQSWSLPTFVLFEDGLLVFNKFRDFDKPAESYRQRLSPTETSDLFHKLVTPDLVAVPDRIKIAGRSHSNTVTIRWRDNEHWYSKSVLGISRKGKSIDRQKTYGPCAFVKSYLGMLSYKLPWKKVDKVERYLRRPIPEPGPIPRLGPQLMPTLTPELDYLHKVGQDIPRATQNSENIHRAALGEVSKDVVRPVPIILGALDRPLLDEVVNGHEKAIRTCYPQELTKNSTPKAAISVKFIIAKDGSVSTASIRASTIKNPEVESCVIGRVMRMQFPKPKGGGIVIVSYPFTFSDEG